MRKPVHPKPKFARGAPKPRRSARRRGVASILAMLFLMVTGSLAAAMAVIAQGNLRTAESSIRTTRAQGAAESGLVFAERRLAAESARFVIRRGVIDAEYAAQLWIGDLPEGVDEVEVGGPVGYDGPDEPSGLAAALRDAHLADASAFAPSSEFAGLPAIQSGGAVVAAPMRLEQGVDDHWFQLTYVPVPGTNRVRVESVGFDRGLRRTVSLEFELRKRIQYALLAPNRVMVGKNVIVEGPVGTRYGTATGELTAQNGDPLVMRSDFRYLNSALTARIDALALAVAAHDADGDGRLRPGHPAESVGLAGLGFGDRDGDQYVDDFDAFLAQYDANSDGGVVWDPVRANAAGISGTSAEFAGVDDQLARLVDLSRPDRNEDGTVDARDVRLGYSDGVLSGLDRYAKVHGRIDFAVAEDTWEGVAGQAWRAIAQGPVRPEENDAAVRFGMAPEDLRVVTTADFLDSAGWFASVARADFHDQAAAGAAAGGTITPAAGAEYEAVPFGSNAAYDYYQRPVYRDMTFTDVRIPKGLNALFVNCRFVGVTYVETEPECGHMNWNYAGALKRVTAYGGGVGYALRFATAVAQLNGQDVPDTRVHSNSIRFDGCTFLGSVAGDTPAEFMHWRNKIQFTGATRFFSDPTDRELEVLPDGEELRAILEAQGEEKLDRMQRSSIMLPGWSVDVGNFTNAVDPDPDLTPRVKLKGTIVAGILDVRGTAEVFGTMLLTFRPVPNQGPLAYNGIPESFNATIGYFGSLDGDGEGALPGQAGFSGFGEVRLRYDPDAKLPDGIPWPTSAEAVASSYREGAVED